MTLRQIVGFSALCLLASTTWLITDLLPSPVTSIAAESFCLLLVGFLGLLAHLSTRRLENPASFAQCALIGLASLGFIGIPFLLLAAVTGKIASTSAVVVFAGMPTFLDVAGAVSSAGSKLQVLPASLMGIAGLLILLPIPLSHGSAAMLGSGMMLLLAMICTAVCQLWLHRLLREFPIAAAVGLAGLFNAVLLAIVGGVFSTPLWSLQSIGIESVRCLLFGVPQIILLMWLTKAISPRRLSVRFVAAPFLTVVEGLVILRPKFEVRTLFGLLLLGLAVYLMLRSDGSDLETSLRLV